MLSFVPDNRHPFQPFSGRNEAVTIIAGSHSPPLLHNGNGQHDPIGICFISYIFNILYNTRLAGPLTGGPVPNHGEDLRPPVLVKQSIVF